MDWLGDLDAHWVWLTLGLLLAALEMLVPGVYLIWLAAAALVTGAMTFAFDLSLPIQVVDFVFLSLIAAFSAKRFLGTAIEHGSGRVKVGDSEWIARGSETAAGERVRIIGTDGSTLLVEPLEVTDNGALPPAEA